MAHIVSGELRKAPYVKPNVGQDGASKLFIVELSEMIKDYQTGEKTYTNYKASLFAKGGQIDYYNSVLVEGNFIVVNSEKLKIEVSECGQYTKLSMENARLENAGYIASGQPQGQSNQQQNGYAPQQQAPQQQANQYKAQQQGGTNQQPQQQYQQSPQQGYQQPQNAPQQQGGFTPKPQNAPQGGASNPMEPTIDFDDDIPF